VAIRSVQTTMNAGLRRRTVEDRRPWRALLVVLLLAGCQAQPPYEGKTVAELTAMLQDGDPAVQTQGAFGLSRLGAEAVPALPALIDALRSQNAQVRSYAALALGEIGPEARTAVSPLTELLRDREWTVRRQAAMALGRIGPDAKPAIAALEKLGQDPDNLVRKAAREALQKIRG
jgi:HEAT repeat protein